MLDPSKAPQESKSAKTYTKIDKFWVLELNKVTGWFEKNNFGPKKLNRDNLKIVRAKNFVLNSSVFEFCKIYTILTNSGILDLQKVISVSEKNGTKKASS